MSGKVRQRNAGDMNTLSVNEKILRECHNLYTDPDSGLIKIAETLNLTLLPPRKKITVLLIGNHSAGKSSFINWYVEEHVQKTGVAIETQGFSFVTSGRKRESLTGNATLHLYPHFEPLRQIKGVTDYLNTEISTSKQKKFTLVTFVDTPGLVDGDMKYPFDVNKAIQWLGDLADLIFVFFDPIGQALCKRTLNLVEELSHKHSDRMRFFLSKADEAGLEADRQRVMMQIVQELCKRPGLNRTGFDMPTIYIPNSNKPSRCVNQIDEVCKTIEKTINQTVQNTLNTLEKDCEKIAKLVQRRLEQDSDVATDNRRACVRGWMLSFAAIFFPLACVLAFFLTTPYIDVLEQLLGPDTTEVFSIYLAPLRGLWSLIPEDYHFYVFSGIALATLLILFGARYYSRRSPTLTRRQKRQFLEHSSYVSSYVKSKKESLYSEYLKQSAAEQDM